MFRESNRFACRTDIPSLSATQQTHPGSATFKPRRCGRGRMTRSVWLKADSEVGDWETRKRRITAGLEAGVDWVLVDESDVEKVRELGEVNVAAFSNGDVHVMEAEEKVTEADATIVGKDGEG